MPQPRDLALAVRSCAPRATGGLIAHALVLTAMLVSSTFSASAQTPEEWLAKTVQLAERAPYRVDYVMDARIEQAGAAMSTKLTADLLYSSREAMRLDMNVAIEAAALGGALEMSGIMVADGENLWVEMNNPMTGLQVIKTPITRLDELNSQSGLPGMSGNLDPFEQLAMLTRWMTFEVTSKTEDVVTLTGTPTAAFEEELGASATALGDRMVLQIRRDGAPLSMVLGTAEQPALTMTFTNYEFLAASSLAADAFSYTPPDGATVITP